MTIKLKLFFIAMDLLTLLVYPIVFIYCNFIWKNKPVRKTEENIISAKLSDLFCLAR